MLQHYPVPVTRTRGLPHSISELLVVVGECFLASNWEIASECARTPRLGARPRGAGRRMLSDV